MLQAHHKKIVPPAVFQLCDRLITAGHQTYLVGGGVRDLLLGRAVTDWDIATSALPEQVQAIFPHTVPTGIAHGTVTVLWHRMQVEVTTFRGEGQYSDGRRPDQVQFLSSIEADLTRRDFTINAMAIDPAKWALIDPANGIEDMNGRLIRAVGDPAQRFKEDGLRVLRAVRFAAVLEFAVESTTQAAIAGQLDTLRNVSAERIRDEVFKLLGSKHPDRGLIIMAQTGVFDAVFPDFAHPRGLLNHAEQSSTWQTCNNLPPDAIMRLAYLFCRFQLTQTDQLANCMRFSHHETTRISQLVRQVDLFDYSMDRSAGSLRRWVRQVGRQHVDDVVRLIAALTSSPQQREDLHGFETQLKSALANNPPLEVTQLAIDGQAIMQHLQCPPGPVVGQYLKRLLDVVLDDPSQNDRTSLLTFVTAWMKTSEK